MNCLSCAQPVKRHRYGYCSTCYTRVVKTETYSELPLIINYDNLTAQYGERYELEGFDKAYAHFYRLKEVGTRGNFVADATDRRWCLKVHYVEGFPCPPVLTFVNPYNYEDDNPVWWPRTKFLVDALNQTFDLPYVHVRSSAKRIINDDERVFFKKWLPSYFVKTIAPKILDKLTI